MIIVFYNYKLYICRYHLWINESLFIFNNDVTATIPINDKYFLWYNATYCFTQLLLYDWLDWILHCLTIINLSIGVSVYMKYVSYFNKRIFFNILVPKFLKLLTHSLSFSQLVDRKNCHCAKDIDINHICDKIFLTIYIVSREWCNILCRFILNLP